MLYVAHPNKRQWHAIVCVAVVVAAAVFFIRSPLLLLVAIIMAREKWMPHKWIKSVMCATHTQLNSNIYKNLCMHDTHTHHTHTHSNTNTNTNIDNDMQTHTHTHVHMCVNKNQLYKHANMNFESKNYR